ncbi:histidine phosphatase family protein [Erythrobacteraceae bacterium CFH 75059]|uniref:histidine phosphatase family protein n=1 Tax=Qipengyuania thermophila TaxID=2509361 RepID=UPI0010215B6D|nr:histidine phosphatase family protein [Qipengyuania thermophila]TCD05258.1 histidine phosphatase family protein [Erythrobacteraceae bacterium CFH 75059]
MSITLLLIRHARHADYGRVLTGRSDSADLSAEGTREAQALAKCVARLEPRRVLASPSLRTRRTAAAIAEAASCTVDVVEALDEVDFGAWRGRSFAELDHEPDWRAWNERRATARPPGGESMTEVQGRAWRAVEAAATVHDGGLAVMVSHCDVIRAVVAKALGLSLDHLLRFDIDPASISRLAVGTWGARVISLNETPA